MLSQPQSFDTHSIHLHPSSTPSPTQPAGLTLTPPQPKLQVRLAPSESLACHDATILSSIHLWNHFSCKLRSSINITQNNVKFDTHVSKYIVDKQFIFQIFWQQLLAWKQWNHAKWLHPEKFQSHCVTVKIYAVPEWSQDFATHVEGMCSVMELEFKPGCLTKQCRSLNVTLL